MSTTQNTNREQGQQRQKLTKVGQNGGGSDAAGQKGVIELFPLNNAPQTFFTLNDSNNFGNKRKIPTSFGFGPEDVETWGCTEIEQETFTFLWTLKNYAALSNDNEEVKSPIFQGGPKSKHSWHLKMNPKKKMDEHEYFAIYLVLNGFGKTETETPTPTPAAGDSADRRLKVRFQISLLHSNGRPGKQAGGTAMPVCPFKLYSIWGFDKFLTSADLINPTLRLVEEDTLKIHCRIWIDGEIKHKSGIGGAAAAVTNRMSIGGIKKQRNELLANNLRELLADAENSFSDVTILTETKAFKAHKVVLAVRSPVFKAMFESDSDAKSPDYVIDIYDFSEDVVNSMLEYIYTGEIPSLNEKASDLLPIAKKYGLIELEIDCEYAIAANITVENCSNLLKYAQRHEATSLKAKVIKFITGAAGKAMDEYLEEKPKLDGKNEKSNK